MRIRSARNKIETALFQGFAQNSGIINNLSDHRTVAELNIPNIPWWKKDDDVYLLDLLNNRKRRVNYSKPAKNLIMRLKPYDSVWFKVEKLSAVENSKEN